MTLERVVVVLCSDCLDGKGGECHTPGCALWLNRAPDLSFRDRVDVQAEYDSSSPLDAKHD